MKTINHISTSWRLVLLTFVICLYFSNSASSQQYIKIPQLYAGFEVGSGTRSLKVKSDIDALNGIRVDEEGINLGVLVGTNSFQFKVRKGFYNSSQTSAEKVKLNELDVSLNGMILSFFHVKSKYIKPYLAAGLGRNSLTYIGSYALPEITRLQANSTTPTIPCCCQTSNGGPPSDPDPAVVDPEIPTAPISNNTLMEQVEPVDKKLGKVVDSRINTGIGIQILAPTKKRFISMFVEVKYGILISSNTLSPEFKNTRVSNPIFANFGIAFGLKTR